MIDGILDLSKIEAGKMTVSLEHFDVRAVVNEVVDTMVPLVQKNQNTVSVWFADDVGVMHADLMKTRQILLNLLSNAAKFTRHGTIAIDIEAGSWEGRPAVSFKVADTGVGMNADYTAKIFEPFTQADVAISRKYGGTGLGLAIVSRFCALMGGHVSVDSDPGRGSCFTVLLPLDIAAAADAAALEAASIHAA